MSAAVVAVPDRPSEVAAWIRSLNPTNFDAIAAVFEAEGVDGSILLHDLDEDWLSRNVTKELPRKRIWRAICELRTCASGDHKSTAAVVALPTVTSIGAYGRYAKQFNITNHNYSHTSELRVEPCDFVHIIDSKLSDINLDNFGRVWLYQRLWDWLEAPIISASNDTKLTTPLSLKPPKVLLITGEPVRTANRSFSVANSWLWSVGNR